MPYQGITLIAKSHIVISAVSMRFNSDKRLVLGPTCAPQEPPGLRMAPLRSAGVLLQNDGSKARSETARVLFGRCRPFHSRRCISLKACLRTAHAANHHVERRRTPAICHQDQAFPFLRRCFVVFLFFSAVFPFTNAPELASSLTKMQHAT